MVDERLPLEAATLEIDHPAHPDWIYSGLKLVPSADAEEFTLLKEAPEYRALRDRYGESGDTLRFMVQNIGSITMNVDSKRATHELANLHLLNVAASGIVSPDALGEYRAFAGKPERAGEYIVWFAKVVTAAYTNFYRLKREHDEVHGDSEVHRQECRSYEDLVRRVGGVASFKNISLDLGGKRQSGDWNSTADLDVWAENLNAQIQTAEPTAEVKLARTAAEQMRGYKLYPWRTRDMSGAHDPSYTSATIRRRRREAMVRIPGFREIVIIKESKGWILPNRIEDDSQRDLIVRALANWKESEHEYENSPISRIGGKVFERAINNRDTTLEVSPTHAHYYMQASPDLHVVPSQA